MSVPTNSVVGRRVSHLREMKHRGDFMFVLDDREPPVPQGMNIACPGCSAGVWLPFVGSIYVGGTNFWTFDGSRDVPTLSPSILCKSCCGWHGYLRAGKFESC